jgi:hypothetical protein
MFLFVFKLFEIIQTRTDNIGSVTISSQDASKEGKPPLEAMG